MIQQNASLFLSPQEMMIVWNALMEMPGKMTYGILRKMQQQMTEQKLMPSDTPETQVENKAPDAP